MATDRIDEGGREKGYSVGERERESEQGKGGKNDRYFSPDDRGLRDSLFLYTDIWDWNLNVTLGQPILC